MDFLDILDFFMDPAIDLVLCGGDFVIWFKKRISSFLLAAGNIIFGLILLSAIESASPVWGIIGAIGMIYFIITDVRYTIWWFRYGRFGAESPWADEIPLPRGDLMNTPPEDAPFGTQHEASIWEQMGVRK